MAMTTPRDLFLHELADAMSAEQIILKMLPDLQKEAQHPEVKTAFKEHEQETRQQIDNITAVFKQLGEEPDATTCFATEGLKKEHDHLKEEDPSPEVLELGILGGAAKTEHYEMATYTSLVQMARDLDEREAVDLLSENLKQEKEMAHRVEKLAKMVGKDAKAAVPA